MIKYKSNFITGLVKRPFEITEPRDIQRLEKIFKLLGNDTFGVFGKYPSYKRLIPQEMLVEGKLTRNKLSLKCHTIAELRSNIIRKLIIK